MEDAVDILKRVGLTAVGLSPWVMLGLFAKLWGRVRCVNRADVLGRLRHGRAVAHRATCPDCGGQGLAWRRETWREEFHHPQDDSDREYGYILHCVACRREFPFSAAGVLRGWDICDRREQVGRATRTSYGVADRQAKASRSKRCT